MARQAIRLARPYAVHMPEVERPTSPWSARIGGILVLVLLGWLLFGSAISVVRAVIALIGYIVVGLVAYNVGKVVGPNTNK